MDKEKPLARGAGEASDSRQDAHEDDNASRVWPPDIIESRGPSDKDRCEDASRIGLPGIIGCIAGFLSANEVACTLRLVCRATAQQFADQTTVRPAQPVPRWCFAAECRRVCRGLTLAKRQQLVCLTAASGDVANLEVALAETGCPLDLSVLQAVARAGELGMCQWLVGPGRVPWDEATATRTGEAAAAGGHGHVIDWCLEAHDGTSTTCEVGICVREALSNGHDELAWRLVETYPGHHVSGRLVLTAAIEGASLASLQRVWQHYRLVASMDCTLDPDHLSRAAASPTADWRAKCEFLLLKGCRLSGMAWRGFSYTMSKALKRDAGYDYCSDVLERLTWLQGLGADLSGGALEAAAHNRGGGLVATLLEQGVRPHPMHLLVAAKSGSLRILQALLAAAGEGVTDMAGPAREAAEAGSLAGLSWLVETYGAEACGGLTPELFLRAAKSGNVELMAWLLARGCEVDPDAWGAAAGSGCEAALEFLSERGCPKPIDGSPYYSAADNCDVRTMAVLLRLGTSFGPDGGQALFRQAAAGAQDPSDAQRALAWLRDSGCCVDWAKAERAARQKYWVRDEVGLLAWLAQQNAQTAPPLTEL